MTIETEVKVEVTDLDGLRLLLGPLQPVLLSPRHFEDNYLFDFPDVRIRTQGCLLRVRLTNDGAVLTYKGASRPGGPFKSREELETALKDGRVAMEILSNIGLQVWFRYQKYREEYAIRVENGTAGEVHLALDETPVGSYAELEGAEESIRRLASRLGFSESQLLRDSYYSLYLRHCRERGVTAAHMLFP